MILDRSCWYHHDTAPTGHYLPRVHSHCHRVGFLTFVLLLYPTAIDRTPQITTIHALVRFIVNTECFGLIFSLYCGKAGIKKCMLCFQLSTGARTTDWRRGYPDSVCKAFLTLFIRRLNGLHTSRWTWVDVHPNCVWERWDSDRVEIFKRSTDYLVRLV